LAAPDHEVYPISDIEGETKLIFSHFFDILFPPAIVFGGIALMFSIIQSMNYGWHHIVLLHVAMYFFAMAVLIFRRRIPVNQKIAFMLVLLSISVIQSLYSMGLAGEGILTLIVLCIFSWFFLGIRAGLIVIISGITVLSAIGVLICTGIIKPYQDVINYISEPLTWAVHIALVLLYIIPLVLIINYMRKRIIDSLVSSRKMNAQLQEEIKVRAVTENDLRESEEKYKGVVENSLVAFYIIQDGLFRFVNTCFCKISGYEYAEIVDKMDPLDLIHPDDMKKAEKIKADFLDGKSTIAQYDLKLIKKDGTIINVKIIKNTISYNGRPAYFGTALDVTKEKVLEAKLLQAQKMEAVGTLVGGIAHDFNNILTALMGYGTILQMKMDGADPLRRYTDQIISASEKAINLTRSLLTFSRMQPVTLKSVNLNRAVQGTENLLRRLITENITLETDLAPDQINILADNIQIDQILFNLVTNARDALPKGGRLKISTKKAELNDEFIRINGFGKKGRYALLAVSDNGIGMDEKIINRIFDPFFTTKDVGKGTGLGLSTVYGIVKQNHGYITVRSEPEKGTDFNIYIPLLTGDYFDQDKFPVKLRDGAESILVAEDNNEARSFIKDILEQQRYRVVEASDGDDAIKKFKDNNGISLVILDSIMPKINGKEACAAIKGIQSEVLTLFMSGYSKEALLTRGMIEPEVEFISKPFAPDELLKKVGDLLDRHNQIFP
ncbi:MAG: response regulator, partial [Deltaproteobacteria bacterium]|nr:response regulator [Deltaproteobacteria bacterium]